MEPAELNLEIILQGLGCRGKSTRRLYIRLIGTTQVHDQEDSLNEIYIVSTQIPMDSLHTLWCHQDTHISITLTDGIIGFRSSNVNTLSSAAQLKY